MLENAHLLAKIGADTAENGPQRRPRRRRPAPRAAPREPGAPRRRPAGPPRAARPEPGRRVRPVPAALIQIKLAVAKLVELFFAIF